MMSNPEDRKVVTDAIKEISNSMLRMESDRDLQKEIVEAVCEKVDIDKADVKKLAKIYHKQNYNDVKAAADDLQGLYEELYPS